MTARRADRRAGAGPPHPGRRQRGRRDPAAGARRRGRRPTAPTSSTELIGWGPGPRASQALMLAVRARALLQEPPRALGRRRGGAGAAGAAPSHGADLHRARRGRDARPDHRAPVRSRSPADGRRARPTASSTAQRQRAEQLADRAAAAAGGRRAGRRDRRAGRARPPARRPRRDVLAVPALPAGRSDQPHRLAPVGAQRRSCSCATRNGRRPRASGCGPTARRRWPTARPRPGRPRASARCSCCWRWPSLLTRAGERIALLGERRRPTGGRVGMATLCEDLLARAGGRPQPRAGRSRCRAMRALVLVSDFFIPLDELRARLRNFVAMGVRGHLLQVLDPAEPDLPFAGRVRFEGMEQEGIALIGNVDGVRRRYQGRLEAHRAGLRDLARSLGWTFASHRQRPAARARAAGALHCAVDQGAGLADARSRPARLRQSLAPGGAGQPAGAVVAAADHPAGAEGRSASRRCASCSA